MLRAFSSTIRTPRASCRTAAKSKQPGLRSEARLRPCKDIRPCGSMIWRPGGTPCGVAPRRISNISEIKMAGFYEKPAIFCVIARPQRGRGNLKAEGMESRGEARERKTTKIPEAIPKFNPSRRDATSALPRKRHFTRASARISRAQHLFLAQRAKFTARPCCASFRDAVSFRLRLPRRCRSSQ